MLRPRIESMTTCSLELTLYQLSYRGRFMMFFIYSAGEEKSPYFLFHGETAFRKVFRFQGETANFSEKFQGNSSFPEKTWSFIGKTLKFKGEIQVFPGENIGFLGEFFHYFSQKKRQLIMEKNKKWGFFFTCPVTYTVLISPSVGWLSQLQSSFFDWLYLTAIELKEILRRKHFHEEKIMSRFQKPYQPYFFGVYSVIFGDILNFFFYF